MSPSAGRSAFLFALLGLVCLLPRTGGAQGAPRPRARDLGIPFGGQSGPLDAITDVPGVEVGHVTLKAGKVRSGVTAIFPLGRDAVARPVFAATHSLNGSGEMTGTLWIKESGLLSGPVMLTNTNGIGAVRDGVIAWAQQRDLAWDLGLPVVAETWDGFLNDIDSFPVKREHALQAMDAARPGPVAEGSVGGGTGMICHGFKGGIGTASRQLPDDAGGYTVGVLVQCNYGSRRLLSVAGVPVGEELADLLPCYTGDIAPKGQFTAKLRPCSQRASTGAPLPEGQGSIIVVVATNAPLLPHQLERLAHRVPLAIGKMGGLGENYSGDIFLAFSTQAASPPTGAPVATVSMLDHERINPLFEATVQATEESILNAMLASDTMTSAQGTRVYGLPVDRFVGVMKKHGRLKDAPAPTPR
ncbi:P1 family peptidase [Myxococcaceae bacterium JPH2]|nr:P1 family peptidase [Myxococcaceae bacterium JPH2]